MTKQEAFQYIKKFIADTWTVWEQGENDHRVGKRLDALSGRVGYDSQLDIAFATLDYHVNQ